MNSKLGWFVAGAVSASVFWLIVLNKVGWDLIGSIYR